jgi:hypothetical membrane protein
MKKYFALFLFLFAIVACQAQEIPTTIKATSTVVDIRVDNDYFVKGGWILDATKKPDIFSIGSKWLYETKKVTFITDIDSISFNAKPGYKYNFIILLNEKTPNYIQISTLSNPVFMTKRIVGSIVFGLITIFILFYFFRKKVTTETLLRIGYAAPILFWLMTFISGFIHKDYNHFKNVISELGAIETKSEIFTSSALLLLTVLCTLYSIGFYSVAKKIKLNVIPIILSFSMPITMLWAGIFTLGNEFHSLTGALPFLQIIGFLLGFFLWKRNKDFRLLSHFSLFCFLLSMLILLRFIKPFGYEYEGLIQRFFYLAWTIWSITITYYFSNKMKRVESV